MIVLIRGGGPRRKTDGQQMMEEWLSMLERGEEGSVKATDRTWWNERAELRRRKRGP